MKFSLHKAALLVSTIIWGSSFVMMKNVTDVISVSYLLALRFTIGTIFMVLFCYKDLMKMSKHDLVVGIGIGIILFLGFFVQTVGITDTTPGKNAFLTATYCVLVPFVYWIVDKHRPDVYSFVAAFMCIFGIGMVSLTQTLTIGFGDFWTLVSSVFYALQIVAIAKFARGKNPMVMTTLQLATCMVLSWMVVFMTSGISSMQFNSWVSVFLLGVFASAVGTLLQNYGQQGTDASTASLLLSLEAVFGVLFSVLLYHEIVTVKMFIGFACIFGAVVVSETKLSFLKKRG
ncbi:MAG: DMT family transporter [Erysipelotrichaceae bacterium]|nr:DMT family transporter [Erysipelotrichaceae bacterium]